MDMICVRLCIAYVEEQKAKKWKGNVTTKWNETKNKE